MDSRFDIIWSPKARISYFNILDYLEKNWSKKELKQFHKKTEVILNALSKNPKMFPTSKNQTKIRKAIIDKHNTIFYHLDEKNLKILLLIFFDNRQDPKKLLLDI